VVKALRSKSEGPGSISGVARVFSMVSDHSMCPGVDSASKNEYQVNPGGKVGRCVRLTTYHPHVPMSRNLEALTSWNPVGLFRPVMGQLYPFTFITDLLGPLSMLVYNITHAQHFPLLIVNIILHSRISRTLKSSLY
jgi:hypothetical protein